MQPDNKTSPTENRPPSSRPTRITLNPVQARLLADRFLDSRLELGQSQYMLGFHAGVSEATVHQLEHARNLHPRLDRLIALADQLYLEPAELDAILTPVPEPQARTIAACVRDNVPSLTDLDVSDIMQLLTALAVAHIPTSGSHRAGRHRYDRQY